MTTPPPARLLPFTVPLLAVTLAGVSPAMAVAQDDVVTHIFDVGAGLCTVTEAPSDRYMIYDAGRWTGTRCVDAIEEVVDGNTIDLLVVSHPDSDHLGEAEHVLDRFQVKTILRTGFERWDTGNWRQFTEAAAEETYEGASILNLQTYRIEPGAKFSLGEATVTFVAGWGEWEETSSLGSSEARNVISVVLRLDYNDRSVLYAGDAVGRSPGEEITPDFNPTCAHGEWVMANRHDDGVVNLTSDVLIAPHHGANNGSSTCFIERVDPTWVIFSAGSVSRYGHPRDSTAQRYLDHGVKLDSIFRTDRGDNEQENNGPLEWKAGAQGCKDVPGDDDVQIVLTSEGNVEVSYLGQSVAC